MYLTNAEEQIIEYPFIKITLSFTMGDKKKIDLNRIK